MSETSTHHPVWDIATRLTHWFIVLGVTGAWWTAETQRYELHQYIGYAMLVIVTGRIAWGVFGSKHSLFKDFVQGPLRIAAYVRGGMKSDAVGHNPLGGCSVILLLSLLLVQAVSGLFNTDDILFSGPFSHIVDSHWQDRMGVIHDIAFNGLLAAVLVHVLAVLWYERRGTDLLGPMLKGKTEGRYSLTAPAPVWRWLLILAVLTLALWQAIELAPAPQTQWF